MTRMGGTCRRLAATALGLTLLTAVPTSPVAAADPLCVDGFSRLHVTSNVLAEDVFALKPQKALVAGGVAGTTGTRKATINRFKVGDGWKRQATFALGADSAFVAIDGSSSSRPWAVGYGQGYSWLSPLLARQRSDGSWRRVSIPVPTANAALTDVSAASGKKAWAVGFRLAANGTARPWATKWSGGVWSGKSPGLRAGERGTLTGVSTTTGGGTWIVGSVMRNGVERFYAAQRVGGAWKRYDLDSLGSGALSAVTAPTRTRGWAVGYRHTSDGPRALVLRWDGDRWAEVEGPKTEGATVLFDVSVGADGLVAISGSAWRPGVKRMRGLAAERDGGSWSVHYTKLTGKDMALTGLDGDPTAEGWVVGRDLAAGVAAKTCVPDPVVTASKGEKRSVRQLRRTSVAAAGASAVDGAVHLAEVAPAPRDDLGPARRLQITAAGAVSIKDKAKAVGLPVKATTYGAVVRDFDGDGTPDIFLGGHAGQARLYLRRGSGYELQPGSFGSGDRHGCAAADVDGSGLPDLYCNFGGGRGLGTKSNQLWLDPAGSARRLADDVGGAVSPLGRGRVATFLDVDADGRKDLILGQQPDRLDGLPSVASVYLREGSAAFRHAGAMGLPTGVGAHAFDSGDIDRDGRVDLLFVYRTPRATGTTGGVKLLRNTAAGFRNVSGAYGIRNIGERDAELARLDGDAKPDLIQLSGDRIRISLQRKGKLVKVFERRISKGVALAVGDADGDGDRDIYVLRQKAAGTVDDLVLFNDGDGRSYTAVKAPSRAGGKADDVYPIDHDGNGLTDFLVLNGSGSGKGPLQLISFYR